MNNQRKPLKQWFWEKSNEVKYWWNEKKEWAIVVVPVVGGGVIWTAKKLITGAITGINLNKEARLKDLYVYDRSLGHYWKLTRKLSNNEWLQINERRKDGESMGDILLSMRVI